MKRDVLTFDCEGMTFKGWICAAGEHRELSRTSGLGARRRIMADTADATATKVAQWCALALSLGGSTAIVCYEMGGEFAVREIDTRVFMDQSANVWITECLYVFLVDGFSSRDAAA